MTDLLVTGASGFVGGAFLARFRGRSGLRLHGVGRRAVAAPDYTAVDLSRPFDLPLRPDAVIHAAARAAPWGSERDFERDNVEATRQVIAFCERAGRPRLVYVSSSSVFYRDGHQLGITEDAPIGPRFVNAYARTKRAGELLVERYGGAWVIVRPRAVFGPGDTVLLPRILAAAARGRLPLLEADGAPAVGDLIYVDALCDYLLTAATKPGLHGAFNVTNGRPVPIQAFLLDVLARLGLPAPARRVSVRTALLAAAAIEGLHRLLRRPGEPPLTRYGVGVLAWSKTFDVRRALAELGPPSVSLEDGVEELVRWYRARESVRGA